MTGTAVPERAFIIHVPSDVRRTRNIDRLTTSLRSAGVEEVVVFDGVVPDGPGPMYSRGEWGCYQSHVACLRRIADEAHRGPAIVVEDDAVLNADPARLRDLLTCRTDWDFLHLGYLSNTVFRAWDDRLLSQELLTVRGVLYGLQCYAARPEGLLPRVAWLDRLPWLPPDEGGGIGIDGALCELKWRQPELVRLAPPRSLFHTLPGVDSGLRPTSVAQRGKEFVREYGRSLLRRQRGVPPTRV